MTIFLRVIDAPIEEKSEILRMVVAALRNPNDHKKLLEAAVFERDSGAFGEIPSSPFAYWLPETVRKAFQNAEPFRSEQRFACNGASTCDDFRYCRLWYEISLISNANYRYVPYNQGNKFSRFAKEVPIRVPWDDKRRTFFGFIGRPGRWQSSPVGGENYFKPALTWPLRGSRLSVQAVPLGCAFSVAGKVAIADEAELPWLLALLNSSAADYALRVFAGNVGGVQYESGLIERVPIPVMTNEDRLLLIDLARRAWSLKRSVDYVNETSYAFILPPGVIQKVMKSNPGAVAEELESIQKQIDDRVFHLYGIGANDRATILASIYGNTSSETLEERDASDESDESAINEAANIGSTDGLNSWLVGVAFGRFDPRLAIGDRPVPVEAAPFDPLPSRSPGMYPEGEEPADRPDILVDDEGHADDLARRTIEIAERVKLDVADNLRGWLAKEFFPLHVKMYSKNRRKAPIYWQLAIPSVGYSVWLYIHSFTKDTLFRVLNDYVAPKIAHEERHLESLMSDIREGATAAQRKQFAAQETYVEELRAFLDEVKRVAPLWRPNLDDGVIINLAPLWRLVPQNKQLQKELKSTWNGLCEGKYDWAHLAMHLWPERVVPKCAIDRSLAIAHGIENVFWFEGEDGKIVNRKTPTKSVDDLVREKTSAAVKSALKSLLNASAQSGVKRPAKKGRRDA